MLMHLLSLSCSILIFLTIWLIVPMFVLGPLGVWFGWKAYRQAALHGSLALRVLAIVLMFVAIASVCIAMELIRTGYRA